MELASLILILLSSYEVLSDGPGTFLQLGGGGSRGQVLPVSFPSKEDTLAYVDALKHSNFSQWRSLEEVARTAGGGSCSGAVNTSVLTALYLLGLFNLCAASPPSCCIPSLTDNRRRRRKRESEPFESLDTPPLHPLLNVLTQNLSSLSLEQFNGLPQVSTPHGGKVPVHISVVEQVRKLWDSNPRLLSNHPCKTATEAVRSSFISLSGVASGIILAYSIAQLNQCYPEKKKDEDDSNKIWLFPIPSDVDKGSPQFKVRSLPPEMPVEGDDDPDDGCDRTSVRMVSGECAPLLSSAICPYMQWVLLNRETRKGGCYPRLCSDNKVFVESDQMCHDVSEPGFCPKNQRLFLTAWGEAVCDCLDGMFYGPDKKCHRIFDRAYCLRGHVLQFHKPSKTLTCKVDPCNTFNDDLSPGELPFAKSDDDVCYQFGSTEPCEETDAHFGFDIESLETSCVSLVAAGLLQTQRSYQYSHMSFPSFPDQNFPHYEVSYVILNGSTWELMMRTVGREKRSSGPNRDKNEVLFFDTREFPVNLEEVVGRFQGLKAVGPEMSPPERGSKSSERKRRGKRKSSSTKVKIPSSKSHEMRLGTTVKNGERKVMKRSANSRRFGKKLKYLFANRASTNSRYVRHLSQNVKGEDKVDINFDPDNDDGRLNNDNHSDLEKSHEKRNDNEILIKIMTGKSDTCKWQISFYSQMPNVSFHNSTSINILGHPNFSTFKITKIPNDNTIEIQEVEKDEKEILDEETHVNKQTEMENENGSGRNSPKLKPRDESLDNTLVQNTTTERVSITTQSSYSPPRKLSSQEHLVANYDVEEDDAKEMKEEFSLVKERVKSLISEKIKELRSEDRDLHIEKGIQKVSQSESHSPSEPRKGPRKPTLKKRKNKLKGKRRKKQRRRSRIRGNNAARQRNRKGKNKRIGETSAERKLKIKNFENEITKSNIFGNLSSLPDYLRNRGRRQAGIKRGSKLGPGIINAPLLNQCRPGAKRDYNGHCRPKVIPSLKVPPPKKRSKLRDPSPPRMKCKEGKRLDSRGVCRATFSGLG